MSQLTKRAALYHQTSRVAALDSTETGPFFFRRRLEHAGNRLRTLRPLFVCGLRAHRWLCGTRARCPYAGPRPPTRKSAPAGRRDS